jgi:hypothetical protein
MSGYRNLINYVDRTYAIKSNGKILSFINTRVDPLPLRGCPPEKVSNNLFGFPFMFFVVKGFFYLLL